MPVPQLIMMWSYCIPQKLTMIFLNQVQIYFLNTYNTNVMGNGLGCLTPLSIIFQLYRCSQETGIPGENHGPVENH